MLQLRCDVFVRPCSGICGIAPDAMDPTAPLAENSAVEYEALVSCVAVQLARMAVTKFDLTSDKASKLFVVDMWSMCGK